MRSKRLSDEKIRFLFVMTLHPTTLTSPTGARGPSTNGWDLSSCCRPATALVTPSSDPLAYYLKPLQPLLGEGQEMTYRAVLFDVGGPIDLEFAWEIAVDGAIASACGWKASASTRP